MLPVRILGTSARTPVGLTAAASAAAVRAGISRVSAHPFLCDQVGEPVRMACDARLPPDLCGVDRLFALAKDALEAVCRPLFERLKSVLLPVHIAFPEPRPGWTATMTREIVTKLQRWLSGMGAVKVSAAPPGHAGALMAVEAGVGMLSRREAEICVVGGVDSYHETATLAWLEDNLQLFKSGSRAGFLPGEAAGFVALGTEGIQRHLAAPGAGRIVGVGSATESAVIKTDVDTLGIGLSLAVERAMAMARPIVSKAGAIYCDINGERYRNDEWGFVALRCHDMVVDATDYTSGVGSWGDVGAATGALNMVLATQAWARGYGVSPVALISGGSEAGQRCAVVVLREGGG